jgi:hypothetical protein
VEYEDQNERDDHA